MRKQRAIERLRPRTFEEQTDWLENAAPVVFFLLSALSVITSIGFFIDMITPVAGFWQVAAAIGLIVLIGTEGAERLTTKAAFRTFYSVKSESPTREGRAGALRWSAAFFFISLSLCLSTVGCYYSYKQVSNISTGIQDVYSASKDSLLNIHNAEIAEATRIASEFDETNKVIAGGKRVLRVSATDTYESLIADVQAAKKAKSEALAALTAKELQDVADGTNKTEYNAYIAAVWVFGLSLAKVLFMWFFWYADYRVKTEAMDAGAVVVVEQPEPQRIEIRKPTGFQIAANEKPQIRACKNCEKKLPDSKRKTAKFCCPGCKNDYHNNNKK